MKHSSSHISPLGSMDLALSHWEVRATSYSLLVFEVRQYLCWKWQEGEGNGKGKGGERK